ncbi:34-kDa subunit of RNA polymerase III (C) [Thoreauomyces humboldtii]|nr:34-kDa subunit of RNA polymerase III (C) [Thoreauomyces humboldtii]
MPPKAKSGVASLSSDEQQLLAALRAYPKPVTLETMNEELGWDIEQLRDSMNNLSTKQYVEFLMGRTGELTFKARSVEEASKTGGMKDEERVIYRIVKDAKNTGIWIKHLKDRSGLGGTQATAAIKALEKRNIIKFVKPVKNPYRKVYMLFDVEPSTELTGGTWYTDNEMDMDFIEQLSAQVYKAIVMRSYPDPKSSAIYPSSHASYPTATDMRKYIFDKNITTVQLTVADVQSLLDRLYYDGKVTRIQKVGGTDPDDSDRMDTDHEDGDDFAGETVRDLNSDIWMYKAVRGAVLAERNAFTDLPCGRCPVQDFCSETGPVNPSNCRYFKDWLA